MLTDTSIFKVAKGVWGIKDVCVNVYFISTSSAGNWILIDAGVRSSGRKIRRAASCLFGNRRPDAIVLTHGHFDHVGALETLIRLWQVPVYAHRSEAQFLNGSSPYPRPDPFAGGGMLTFLSFLYPNAPKNIGFSLNVLSQDGPMLFMHDWRVIHTPGHSPGHISLFRSRDRLLIAGDAFVTTRQEALWHVIRQKKIIAGPPRYYTSDWVAARESVNVLEFLNPAIVATGHGRPMKGENMHQQLRQLALNFVEEAVPGKRKHVYRLAAGA